MVIFVAVVFVTAILVAVVCVMPFYNSDSCGSEVL